MKTSAALILMAITAVGAFLLGRQFPVVPLAAALPAQATQVGHEKPRAISGRGNGRAEDSMAPGQPGTSRGGEGTPSVDSHRLPGNQPGTSAEARKSFLLELDALAAQDPVRALDLALAWGVREGENGAITAIRQLVLSDPQLAAEYGAKIAASPMGLDALEHVANDWARADPAAAEAWARSYQGPGADGVLLRVLTEAVRAPGPGQPQALLRAAAELPALLTHPGEGDYVYATNRAAETITDQMLATQPPQTSLEWALTMPDGRYRQRTQQTALDAWLQKDAPAAASWIDHLPTGSPRDALTARLVHHLRQQDPEGARRWADSISDPDFRAKTIRGAGL